MVVSLEETSKDIRESNVLGPVGMPWGSGRHFADHSVLAGHSAQRVVGDPDGPLGRHAGLGARSAAQDVAGFSLGEVFQLEGSVAAVPRDHSAFRNLGGDGQGAHLRDRGPGDTPNRGARASWCRQQSRQCHTARKF